jgi:hypothetical protein
MMHGSDVSLALLRFSEKMELRSIVPDLEPLVGQGDCGGIRFQPGHCVREHPDPLSSHVQSGGRDVQHGEVRVALSEQVND